MRHERTRPAGLGRRSFLGSSALAVGAVALPRRPRAAPTTIRIAEQFGIGYLPLHVIRDRGLLAKHGREAGIEVEIEWVKLSGGAAMNDGLLSGSIDIASAGGVTPLLTLWDRTRGNLDVRAISASVTMPYYLLSSRPGVASIDDLGPEDKIAVPSVGVSIQARILQMAAAQRWGDAAWNRLEPLTVNLPIPRHSPPCRPRYRHHRPFLRPRPPFQYQQLAQPGVTKILSSYDVLGGPSTAILLWATAKFRADQPEVYAAFLKALAEAVALINADREAAVQTYIRVENSKIDPDLLRRILADPEIAFTMTPRQTDQYARFMHKIRAIKAEPTSWRDYFFPEAHTLEGS